MSRRSTWIDHLLEHEKSVFSEFDIQLSSVGIAFGRQLKANEMRHVLDALLSVQERMGNAGEEVNFAIGDWAIQADDWFGEGTSDLWYREEKALHLYRSRLFEIAGATLVQLQVVEEAMKWCMPFLKQHGVDLDVDDLLSVDSKKREVPLGRMIQAFRSAGVLVPDLAERLDSFRLRRNEFIHSQWIKASWRVTVTSASGCTRLDSLRDIEKSTTSLLREAGDIQRIFWALAKAILEDIGEKQGWLDRLASIAGSPRESELADQIYGSSDMSPRVDGG